MLNYHGLLAFLLYAPPALLCMMALVLIHVASWRQDKCHRSKHYDRKRGGRAAQALSVALIRKVKTYPEHRPAPPTQEDFL